MVSKVSRLICHVEVNSLVGPLTVLQSLRIGDSSCRVFTCIADSWAIYFVVRGFKNSDLKTWNFIAD